MQLHAMHKYRHESHFINHNQIKVFVKSKSISRYQHSGGLVGKIPSRQVSGLRFEPQQLAMC